MSRYFQQVIVDARAAGFRHACFKQQGTLRTGMHQRRWMSFTATQNVSIGMPGFHWLARVNVAPLIRLQVLDAYRHGMGSGEVRLYSWLRLTRDAGTPPMNSGALHRYLAEAVWYPTALLPRAGVRWSAIDDSKALASLTDCGTTVHLEFHFDAKNEVAAIYTPARWGRFEKGYRQAPWEGHFHDYFEQDGLRIPRHGEVGWYAGRRWERVWEGTVLETRFGT